MPHSSTRHRPSPLRRNGVLSAAFLPLCIAACGVPAATPTIPPTEPEVAATAPQEFTCGAAEAYDGGSFLDNDGVRLWYRLEGPQTAPVVAVVHGGPGYNTFTFERTAGRLLAEHFRVLYFDQRGCGRSHAVDDLSLIHI